MAGERGDGDFSCYCREQRLRFSRRAHTDRIAERNFIRSHPMQRRRHFRDFRRIDFALVGTAQHARDISADADSVRRRRNMDGLRALEAFRDAAVDVLSGERFRRRNEDRDFIRPGRECRFEPFHVRHEHRIADSLAAADSRHHLGSIGHLRHPFRRHEGRRLDRRESRVGQPVDQRDLDVGRDRRLFVLQAIARSDLDQAHARGKCHSVAYRVHALSAHLGVRLSIQQSGPPGR